MRKNSTIENGLICVAGDDASVWPSVKFSFGFSISLSTKCWNSVPSISAESKLPSWRNKDSQIQFPPRWCQRTAERMEKWMSQSWFTLLITQTSLLPSWRTLEEKVSRLARIKTRLQCMSRPSRLCPPHALEKMPKVWRFNYLNSFAKARSRKRGERRKTSFDDTLICTPGVFV